MAAQRLRLLLEALNATQGVKNAAGEVRDVEALLKEDSLARLDTKHAGVYALFIFDPKADTAVLSYLEGGSLANDSGAGVLALHERVGAPAARAAVQIDQGLPLAVDEVDPLVTFARRLFPDRMLQLPGIVFAPRLGEPGECIYVPLSAASRDQVLASVRNVLARANDVVSRSWSGPPFVDAFAFELARGGINYQRSGARSVREEMTHLLRFLWDHRKDLMALVPVVGKLLAKPEAKTP